MMCEFHGDPPRQLGDMALESARNKQKTSAAKHKKSSHYKHTGDLNLLLNLIHRMPQCVERFVKLHPVTSKICKQNQKVLFSTYLMRVTLNSVTTKYEAFIFGPTCTNNESLEKWCPVIIQISY